MKRARISTLHAAAKQRPAGYLEACMKAGKASADGQWIIFTDEAHASLRAQFNPLTTGRSPLTTKPGLGDAIHAIAGPIGRAIKWPCLKGDGTTDLKPGSPCDRARRALNKVQI